MEVKKLNTTYPEFTKYLLDHQTSTPSSSSSSSSSGNNFLYYNNKTRSIEGVSMLSSYTSLKVSATKSIKVITVSPQLTPSVFTSHVKSSTPKIFYLPSSPPQPSLTNPSQSSSKSSLLPFFHQFIYTIKFVDNESDEKNFVQKLNEPTMEASRLRASLVRNICSQLDMSTTSLRFNWIEKLKSSRFESSSSEEEEETTNNNMDYYDNDVNNVNYNNESEPEFITESVGRPR